MSSVKDVPALVDEYLANDDVVLKSEHGKTFDTSIMVFFYHEQTPIPFDAHAESNTAAQDERLEAIKKTYQDDKKIFTEQRQALLAERQAGKR